VEGLLAAGGCGVQSEAGGAYVEGGDEGVVEVVRILVERKVRLCWAGLAAYAQRIWR
jgi:hypothetical protein